MRVGHAATLPRRTRHGSVSADRPESDGFVSPGVLVAIVNAGGAIDGSTSGPFGREVRRTIEAGATRVLVDLSRAQDVTSACMNTLLTARRQLFECGGRIAVVLSPSMRHRFEVLGLDRRFLLADSRLQAVRLLGLGDLVGTPRNHRQTT